MWTECQPDVDAIVLSDSMISEFMASAQADFFVGVTFDSGPKMHTYMAPTSAHVGSLVLVPGNSYTPDPQICTVVTTSPRVPPGVAIKRVLEVLS
jgi:hypothetical protein